MHLPLISPINPSPNPRMQPSATLPRLPAATSPTSSRCILKDKPLHSSVTSSRPSLPYYKYHYYHYHLVLLALCSPHPIHRGYSPPPTPTHTPHPPSGAPTPTARSCCRAAPLCLLCAACVSAPRTACACTPSWTRRATTTSPCAGRRGCSCSCCCCCSAALGSLEEK